MAVAILGGAVASTLVSLFVIPALYLNFGKGAALDETLDLKLHTA